MNIWFIVFMLLALIPLVLGGLQVRDMPSEDPIELVKLAPYLIGFLVCVAIAIKGATQ